MLYPPVAEFVRLQAPAERLLKLSAEEYFKTHETESLTDEDN